ncbi:MAG: hypothetical protein ACI9MC_000637 [Kiritimatiellia bacterium]|jgi:hypothetical protein
MRIIAPLLTLALAMPVVAQNASAAEPEQVTMSLREFLKLYDKTRAEKTKPESPPRAYSLASANYVGRVLVDDGEPVAARFTAKMRLDIHKKEGWVRVPLLTSDVALQSAKIDGRPASVVIEGGHYTLVTERRGTLNIELVFATNVSTKTGQSSFNFALVPSGTTELELTVPVKEELEFTIANAREQSDRMLGGQRVVKATLPAKGALSVRWQREVGTTTSEEGEPEKRESRIYAEVYTLVSVGDGLLRAQATVRNSILFAGVDTFDVQIPKGMTLLDVKGAGLRDWSTDENNKLTVVLNYAAENAYSLSLDMEKVIGEGSLEVEAPLVVPLGVERSKGWMGVEARGNLELSGGDASNATNVDVRTLPATILGRTSQPVLLGYKYLGDDAKVPLVVSQHDDVDVLVTLVDQAEATTMFTDDGRRLTSVRYEVRNNRRQFLRLELPEGAELWSSVVAGRSVQPAQSEGSILVPLIRSATSGGGLASFGVEVVYVETGVAPTNGRGSFRADLPKVDVPTTYVAWTVYAPDDAKVNTKKTDGNLRFVERLSRPLGAIAALQVQAQVPQQRVSADRQAGAGALGQGAAPVRVRLPVEGTPYFFEKLLALDKEKLTVGFDFKGLKR